MYVVPVLGRDIFAIAGGLRISFTADWLVVMAHKSQSTADNAPAVSFETTADSLHWSRPEMHRAVVELTAPKNFLAEAAEIRHLIDCIVDAFDFTVMDYGETEFEPHGITAYTVIGESHVSVHTWPERNYAHIELLTCVPIPDASELRRRFPVAEDYLVEVCTDDE